MSVQRQENWLGQQRVDVPHLRAVESSIASDFDLLAGNILAGQVAQIVSGFSIVMSPSPIASPATNLLVNVANGVILHPLATDSGTIFQSPTGRTQEQLTSTNTRVSGSFTSSSTNYIGVDIRRSADSTTADTVQFLDPVALQESPKIVPLARTLDYVLIISTTDFSSTPGVCPIAKVVTDANNNVSSVTDCRRMYFRLGSGGSNPAPQNTYAWVGSRTGGTEIASDFGVADKSIGDFHTWMSAIMSRIQEVAGGQYWYSPVTPTNIKLMRSGAPLANGEYFSYSAGTLTWKGLTFLLPSSPGQYNTITDGSVAMTSGDCVYVDLDFSSNATLTMQKATFQTLGVPTVPGSRLIVAWCLNTGGGNTVYTRDGNWPVGTLFQPATNSALGIVQLLTAANTVGTPIVATVDTATNMLVAAGLSRKGTAGSLAGGPVTIGGDVLDTSVVIGRAATTATIQGTAKLDTLDKNASTAITCNTSIKATASAVNDNGLEGNGNGSGAGVVGTGAIGVRGLGGSGSNNIGGFFKGSGNGSGAFGLVTQQVSDTDYAPQFVTRDSAGNRRALFDHNGYQMGRVSETRQEWMAQDGAGANTTTHGLFGNWCIGAPNGAFTSSAYNVDTTIGARYVQLTTNAVNGNVAQVSTDGYWCYPTANSCIVIEFEAQVDGNANHYYNFGIGDAGSGTYFGGSTNYYWITNSGGGTWTCAISGGGVGTGAGQALALGTWVRFRLEIHGASTAIGVANGNATALLFVNETLVHKFVATSPPVTNKMYLGFSHGNLAATSQNLFVGPVLAKFNRLSGGVSIPSL